MGTGANQINELKRNKTMYRFVFCLILLLLPSICSAGWYVTYFAGDKDKYYSIHVGDGRNNTGVYYVYGANKDGHVYEYFWSSETFNWSHGQDILDGGGEMYYVTLGKKGTMTTYTGYAACKTGSVYEFSWDAANKSWSFRDIGAPAGLGEPMHCVTVGPGRNTRTNYIYASNNNGYIYEYSPEGNWNLVEPYPPTPQNSPMKGVCVGDGRNDGRNRVYGACYDNYIHEYKYSNIWGWRENRIGTGEVQLNRVTIGKGRNDGNNYLYVACGDGRVAEVYYKSDSEVWEARPVLTTEKLDPICEVVVCDGRNDGINRVYAVSVDSRVYEATYRDDNYWEVVTIATCPLSLSAIHFGMARNDGINRLYVACDDKRIYELYYDSIVPTSVVQFPQDGKYYNNVTTISGTAKDNTALSKVEVQVYYLENNTPYYWNGSSWQQNPIGNIASGLEMWLFSGNNIPWETGKEYHIVSYATDASMPPNVENISLKVPVKFTFDNSPPSRVTDLSASPGSTEGEIRLTWSAPGNDVTTNRSFISSGRYIIKYSTNASDEWQSVNSIVIPTSTIKGAMETISIKGLMENVTHYFWLKTEDEAGNTSEISNLAQSRPYVSPLAQPQNFTVVDLQVGRRLLLSWDSSLEPYLARYKIYRSTYSSIVTEKQIINFVGASTTYYIDSGLIDHLTYYYQIIAVDDYSNVSPPSEEKYAYPTDKLPPAPPVGLRAVAGDEKIALYWEPNSEEDVNNYLIERSLSGEGGFEQVAVVPHPTDHYYDDDNLTNDFTYYYRIRAEDYAFNKSAYTNVVSTTPFSGGDVEPPAGISDLVAFPGEGEGEIILSWTSVGDDEYSGNITNGKYVIKYTTDENAAWNTESNYQIEITTDTTPGSREGISVGNLTGGTVYYFWVRTYDDVGNISPLSNRATSYATSDRTPPAKITDLSAKAGNNEGEVVLTWTSPGDDGLTGVLQEGSMFKIQYSTSPHDTIWSAENAQVSISTFNISPGTSLSWTIKNLEPSWEYYFCIWTRDENSNFSEISNIVSSYPQQDFVPPAKITNLQVVLTGGTSVYLLWTAPGDNGNEGVIKVGVYWIKYSFSPIDESIWHQIPYEVMWTTYNVIPGELQMRWITGLLSDTSYYFAIKIKDETPGNWSLMSVVVSTATKDIIPPGRITNLAAAPGIKEGDIVLSWTSPGDNEYSKSLINGTFVIKYTTNTPFSWGRAEYTIVISTTAAPNTLQQLVISGLLPRNTYYFAIRTKDEEGNTSWLSNVVSQQPRLYPPGEIVIEFSQKVVKAGEGNRIKITVYNEKNEIAIGYTGTVSFLTNASRALLPQNYTFTPEDKGKKEFMFIMYTAGKWYIKVEDINNSKLSAQQNITVLPLPASQLILSGIPEPKVVAAGTKLTLAVEAQDTFGNRDTSYNRTVTFSTNDEKATIYPESYTFLPQDGGLKVFSNFITFNSTDVEEKYILARDTVGVEGQLAGIRVYSLFIFKLFVETDKKEVRAGESISVKVTVLDPFNNPYTLYQGSVAFTAPSDPNAVLPSTSPLLNGHKEFVNAVKLYTAGMQEIKVYDIAENRLAGSAYVSVLSEEIVKFTLEIWCEEDGKRVYNKIYADKPAKIKIKAVDRYNNVVTQFNGKVKLFVSSGKIYPQETEAFENGIYEGTIYVEYADSKEVKITCEVASIKGESGLITILPSNVTYKPICYPNPFNPLEKPITIRFYLKKPGEVTIRIYDLSGGLVNTVKISCKEGINYTFWDGKNEYGNVVASGGYIGFIEKRYYDGSVEREKVMIAVIK